MGREREEELAAALVDAACTTQMVTRLTLRGLAFRAPEEFARVMADTGRMDDTGVDIALESAQRIIEVLTIVKNCRRGITDSSN